MFPEDVGRWIRGRCDRTRPELRELIERRVMTSKILKKSVWMVAAAQAAVAQAAVSRAPVSKAPAVNPSQEQLTEAVQGFLVDHGDLCMAKYTWPRDVT